MPKGVKGSGKQKEPKIKIEYWQPAEEEGSPHQFAKQLIPKYHSHLATAKICYLFRTKAKTSGPKVILGQASRMNTRIKAIADFDFIIEIGYDEWKELNASQKTALIDHELCHCGGEEDENTGEMKWRILPHDLEEFRDIVHRHGLWKSDLKEFSDSIMTKSVNAVTPLNVHSEKNQPPGPNGLEEMPV